MYHVSAQGIDERMINVHYYYYEKGWKRHMRKTECLRVNTGVEVSAILRPFSRCVIRNLSRQG